MGKLRKNTLLLVVVMLLSVLGSAWGASGIPQNYSAISTAVGVTLYQSYDSKTYVQKIELNKGAAVRFMVNSINDQGKNKGVYGGDNPTILKKDLSSIWDDYSSGDNKLFSICNGELFGDGAVDRFFSNNVLVYPLIVNTKLITGGNKVNENGKFGLRMLEIRSDRADIRTLASNTPINPIKNQTDAPNVMVGHAVDSSPDPSPQSIGRTMVGVAASNPKFPTTYDTVYILVSSGMKIQEAVQTLLNFGVPNDTKTVMFDGSGSSQLLALNNTNQRNQFVWGDGRHIPQTIGVVAGKAPAAVDKAGFVSDGSYVDNTRVSGGTSFVKEWTIQNNGTTTWNSGYKIKYSSGGRLSSINEVAISGTVPPNSMYTFRVSMNAPAAMSSDKTYREEWKLVAPSGTSINVGNSSTLWTQIVVPAIQLVDGASFKSETYPDGTKVNGSTSFTKEWTLKNTGTTTWNSGYKLKYVSGGKMSTSSEIPISGTVAPNSTYTFKVQMKSPAAASTEKGYREDWKLVSSSGKTINVGGSSTVWVDIRVKKK